MTKSVWMIENVDYDLDMDLQETEVTMRALWFSLNSVEKSFLLQVIGESK